MAGFIAEIIADFPSLELMARARRIAMALRAHLPSSFPDAVAILLESTGEEFRGHNTKLPRVLYCVSDI